MSEERKKILEMLAQGKITAEEADRLLDKIGANADPEPAAAAPKDPRKIQFLRVVVDSSDGDKVNIRVPIGLIKTGLKLGAVLPKGACDRLSDQGVDLNELGKLAEEDMIKALAELQVDVDSNDGDVVRIFCE